MSKAASHPVPGQRLETINCTCGCVVKVADMEPLSTVICPKCERQFSVPIKLGQFLVLKKLGRGAMGQVYEAKDMTLGRHVAVKVMSRKVASDDRMMKDFIREARTVAALNHRNVVQVHSIGVEDGQPYIVMELVDGGRMDHYIVRDQAGDAEALLAIASAAACGLEAAANIGIIHGDVKPANILIDRNGEAKIVDFGLARFSEHQQEGKVYGTPYYIAPELLRGKAADYRSDMYSLGSSLFHALAGRPAFRAPKVKDIVRMRLLEPAPNLRQFVPHFHPTTSAVVARMLEADPDARHGSYRELVDELNHAAVAEQSGVDTSELADLNAAISAVDERASQSGRIAAARSGRIASRSGRISASRSGRVDAYAPPPEPAPTPQVPGYTTAPAMPQPTHRPRQRGGDKTVLFVGIGIVAVAIAGVIVLAVALSGGGGEGGGGGGDGDVPANVEDIIEAFDRPPLSAKWVDVDGGGKIADGVYRLKDDGTVVTGPAATPGLRRAIYAGSCRLSVKVKAIQWAGGSEAVLVRCLEQSGAGLTIGLYNAQGEYYLEAKVKGAADGDNNLAKAKFDSPPEALSLRADYSASNNRWRITYGTGDQGPTEPLADNLSGVSGTAPRTLEILLDQFGAREGTAMDLDEVRVEYVR